MTKWFDSKKIPPPKDRKFCFIYHYGTGIGEWGAQYKDIIGCSTWIGECYHLVVHPAHVNGNSRIDEVMEWCEEKIKEMDLLWTEFPFLPIPEEKKECGDCD